MSKDNKIFIRINENKEIVLPINEFKNILMKLKNDNNLQIVYKKEKQLVNNNVAFETIINGIKYYFRTGSARGENNEK